MKMHDLQTSIELPTIDISQQLDPANLASLVEACRTWGFFHITNHGISKDLYGQICFLSKQIFNLPHDTKLQVGPQSTVGSYTPHFIASPFFESLRVSGPNFLQSAQTSADVLLSHKTSQFSEMLQEYGTRMTELSKKVTKILLMIIGDGMAKKYYKSHFENCHGYLRIINYTPPEVVENEVEGLGMHTDMSCVTIVYQDQIGGLQVKSREGKWRDINPFEGSLVVNIGDMLQAWSNDRFRSSEHRVVLKAPVNRFSLAFFWCFEDKKVILAPEEVVGGENSRHYKPFACQDYLRFRESNETGKFEKVGFTVKDFAGLRN